MSILLLRLSLCAATIIQLTSSQPTYDVVQQHESDVNSCGSNAQMLSQLVSVVSRLQTDVAALTAAMSPKDVTGRP